MEQYAITKFAESFEVVPRALAENAGCKVQFSTCIYINPACSDLFHYLFISQTK